jgi:hypothetical protein
MIEQTSSQSDSTPKSFLARVRSWRGYLFEFVLLFMAVFLGFLAESYRERLSERQLAVEMAQNFYDELLEDSVTFQLEKDFRYVKCDALQKLKVYLRDSSLQHVSKNYVRNFYLGTIAIARFIPTEIILDQLKNSGSLRHFRNPELQSLIGKLSGVIVAMHQQHDYELEFEHRNILPYLIKHNDDAFYDKISSNGKVTFGPVLSMLESDTVKLNFKVANVETYDRLGAINMLGMHRLNIKGSTDVLYNRYQQVNGKLLALLRAEYAIN